MLSMKLGYLIFLLLAFASITTVSARARNRQESPQQMPLYNPKLPDFSKIEITTTKVAPNISMLQGGPGVLSASWRAPKAFC